MTADGWQEARVDPAGFDRLLVAYLTAYDENPRFTRCPSCGQLVDEVDLQGEGDDRVVTARPCGDRIRRHS